MQKDKEKLKVLFIMPLPAYTQNGRFRVAQYAPFMAEENIQYTISPFAFPRFEKILYTQGNHFRKFIYFLVALTIRLFDIYRAYRHDVVVILREACPYGPPLFEYFFRFVNRNIVYDFDDAIWMKQPSVYNRFTNFLKWPGKIKHIIRLSKIVICDITFLEEYARKYNTHTVLLKCPIDDESYQPVYKNKQPEDEVVIGWIGSHSTQVHPKSLTNVYKRLSAKYDNIRFKFIDAQDYSVENVKIELKPFSKKEEVKDIQSFDIGIYPLIDIPYVYGKCGFKAQQYMAIGLPTVSTPLGGVSSFVVDGVNGFIASTENEWVEKLSLLIEDAELRKKMGSEARRTVETRLSVRANAGKFIAILRQAASPESFEVFLKNRPGVVVNNTG